ncbi:MAG: biopolymer transporter ExbD [Kiritimatiellae bacterium]|jgi:biopolymer transport protein ExbD|nr:biopolymer transporter ExbD [Kiritimatiellia bacterium]
MNFRSKLKNDTLGFQIAPMIDIVFLLLCFFVTTQIFSQWETEVDITLPSSSTGNMEARLPGEIIINIRTDGTFVINQQEFDDAGLAGVLTRIVEMFPGQPVLVRADVETPYKHIIKVLDVCRMVDIWNVSFATTEKE